MGHIYQLVRNGIHSLDGGLPAFPINSASDRRKHELLRTCIWIRGHYSWSTMGRAREQALAGSKYHYYRFCTCKLIGQRDIVVLKVISLIRKLTRSF